MEKSFDDDSGLRDFNNLVSDDRVDHVLEKAEYFGYSGSRVKRACFLQQKR